MGQQLIIYRILYNGLQMYIWSSKLNDTWEYSEQCTRSEYWEKYSQWRWIE